MPRERLGRFRYSSEMATITAQVALMMKTGLSEDSSTNTWHFSGMDADAPTGAALIASLSAFYDDLVNILSADVATAGHVVKLYETEAPKPNYPFFEDSFDLSTGTSGTALPSEVAICLSFAGPRVAGEVQARRRGRLYIGPLSSIVLSGARPSAAVQNTLTAALLDLVALVNAIPAIGTGQFGVWSPTAGEFVTARTAWVDDAFDTQRRRGVAPTSRTTVDIPIPT